MKKKSASQSAFFNLRVLIGLFVVLAGVFLALVGLGTFSALTASKAQAQQGLKIINIQGLPPGFDCSTIHEKGIDKQENLRAGYHDCLRGGEVRWLAPSQFVEICCQRSRRMRRGRGLINPQTDTGTHITQSEIYHGPDNPNQIFVTYNDSRSAGGCYAGGSYSSDGGTTFTRLTPSPFCSGHGTNFGDPVVLYNRLNATWHAIFIATGCGGQGLGDWTSTDGGLTWAVGACVHTGSNDDRESGYVDNTSSQFNGRMYVSWNDFARGFNIFVRFSTDNGLTWTERQLPTAAFRNVRSPATRSRATFTWLPWTRWVAASPTGPTTSTAPPTAATPGSAPTQVPPSQGPGAAVAASSPACTTITGDTWAGVSLPRTTT
jgi:hypothetical protein